MSKYRLIIFGDPWDVYQVAHKEWIDNPAITYISTFRPDGWLGMIQRIQFNPKVNAIVRMPWKECWNGYYLRHVKGERLCFLVTGHWLYHESAFKLLPYLRSHYPQSRTVCFVQDLMETIKDLYSRKIIDVDYIKNHSDLFISYDKNDAQKYGILYHPTVFSPIAIKQTTNNQYDLYFLGRDKGRLPLLIEICKEARNRGLRCKMVMIGVPKEKRIACEGVFYTDKSVSYNENLENCAASKCILEILQQRATSATFRTWETIMLNKKLMTNSPGIKDSEVYDARYISVFHDLTDIDWTFVEGANGFQEKNPYQDRIKPQSLVRFIEDKLQIDIEQT